MKCYMYVMLCYVNVIRGVEVPSNCKCVYVCVFWGLTNVCQSLKRLTE